MNKIAYCSGWANGVCSDTLHSALFQQSSLESIQRLLKRIRPVVIGANAFNLFTERKVDLSQNQVVLLSKTVAIAPADNVTIAAEPAEALMDFPKDPGINVLLAGGLSTIDAFMKHGLVDELIMDLEPGLTTASVPLFPSLSRPVPMELIGMCKIGAATIQLHYRILR